MRSKNASPTGRRRPRVTKPESSPNTRRRSRPLPKERSLRQPNAPRPFCLLSGSESELLSRQKARRAESRSPERRVHLGMFGCEPLLLGAPQLRQRRLPEPELPADRLPVRRRLEPADQGTDAERHPIERDHDPRNADLTKGLKRRRPRIEARSGDVLDQRRINLEGPVVQDRVVHRLEVTPDGIDL